MQKSPADQIGRGLLTLKQLSNQTSTALKVIGEIGVDLARFPTVKHFTL